MANCRTWVLAEFGAGVNVGVLGLRSRMELHDKVHGVLKIRIYRIVNK